MKLLNRAKDISNYCVYCKTNVGDWLPYRDGEASPVMLKLKVVGSDVNNFWCPDCECFDRERHLYLFLDALKLFKRFKNSVVLHIAPEFHFSQVIGPLASTYVKGDLIAKGEIQKVDLLSTGFDDKLFDIVIANHVLEHIEDDYTALKEIFRILKPGGFAILNVPFSPLLPASIECKTLFDEDLRNFLFGQEDHVRLYGMDYFDRLSSVGFENQVFDHEKILGLKDPQKYGVNYLEPLILAKKS